jgi:hypothetical protein
MTVFSGATARSRPSISSSFTSSSSSSSNSTAAFAEQALAAHSSART